ncbi:secreted RxLR effector protein 78-like [Carya illinoinensis]|uniref:secreted RxLR effector protein 78-like n=1 Tax=Carya illinoinensis TaxID=32201 RepID=UPI001C725971|nr:secreted RxLR effector protein 78-like [Carya illinoinensis]
MAIKLDMSKAYDRVEWKFLEAIMSKMGFGERWMQLIMECITTVSYLVMINGKIGASFQPERGIRQGDPLSRYLYILCAEGLSALITQAEHKGKIKGVAAARGGMRVSHLFFADDSVLFCRATIEEWQKLQGLLQVYEKASGQC